MAKSIMVQGTMSDVGKSVLCAGLCRVFSQDGWSVRPFKSQNMSLNSGVTPDGGEMGRAQVLQARACGVEPDVRMNPVLLKPTGETGSQVVVLGKVAGQKSATDYYAYKRELRETVESAYLSLASECDLVVIEGAGSPAEINLRRDDFVNMGMAHIASSPVLLVGDVDPGGVFAQLYGTMELLSPEDRALVRGLVVNKFRGDESILAPGLEELERLCGVPVLGVVPWLDLDLDDEDSLSSRLSAREKTAPVDVAVVRLPHLSNFTDFDVLSRHPVMSVRYVTHADELGRPDLLVLPGTKSTLEDLQWLEDEWFDRCIVALAEAGTPVVGICGGYQMLGQRLSDPEGVEGGGEAEGLGLLPVETVFSKEKRTTRRRATLDVSEGFFAPLSGLPLEGYEIHEGTTEGSSERPVYFEEGGGYWADGAVSGNVFGTYLHGFFDGSGVADAFANLLLQARGLPPWEAEEPDDPEGARERELDRLADALRDSLDMGKIRTIVEEGL